VDDHHIAAHIAAHIDAHRWDRPTVTARSPLSAAALSSKHATRTQHARNTSQ